MSMMHLPEEEAMLPLDVHQVCFSGSEVVHFPDVRDRSAGENK